MENIPDKEMHLSPTLQYLARSNLPVILFVYTLLICGLLYQASLNLTLLRIVILFGAGILAWTLLEYLIHRFVFHPAFSIKPLQQFQYFMHGYHHYKPTDLNRLVLPLVLTIPIVLIIYPLMKYSLGINANPLFAGFLLGYMIYDTIHYSVHRYNFRYGLGRYLKRYHFYHHFKANQQCFGVSSPLWDYIFLTKRKGYE